MYLTLTEGDDIYYDGFRGGLDVYYGISMLGGNDKLYTTSEHNLRAYLGAGNDYAQINLMYEVFIYGEAGNDTVDVTRPNLGLTIDGGDGADRVNFLYNSARVTITGGSGNDSFYGNGYTIHGTIQGGVGDDLFKGFGKFGGSTVTIAGGPGNDTYYVNPASPPTIIESADGGIDTVVLLYQGTYVRPANIENVLIGRTPPPPPPPPPSGTITGDDLGNVLNGGAGGETISGLGGNDSLSGNGGDDVLDGGLGNDRLYGGPGADLLKGGAGADLLRGDTGRDQMWGGAGADRYIFNDGDFGGANAATCDVIHDFNRIEGDIIRLNLVDANNGTIGDQAFTFIGAAAFSHVPGQLRYEQVSGNTYLQGDVNGDALADFWIGLDGLHTLGATDLWL